MNTCRTALGTTLLLAMVQWTFAQTPDLEPGVQTSPTPAPAAAQPTLKPAPAPASTAASPPASTAATPQGPAKKDRIELGATQISGNRELPKVMYVVPWRKADPGEFAGRPPNSLLDEALTPVDRDVFRRQNRYYAALEGGAGGTDAAPHAVPQSKDEK